MKSIMLLINSILYFNGVKLVIVFKQKDKKLVISLKE
jgi:hypothetical protein